MYVGHIEEERAHEHTAPTTALGFQALEQLPELHAAPDVDLLIQKALREEVLQERALCDPLQREALLIGASIVNDFAL